MRIESMLQPNCSELGFAFNERDTELENLIDTLRGMGFAVTCEFKGKTYSKLPGKVLQWLVQKYHNHGGNTPDKLDLFVKLPGLEPGIREALMKNYDPNEDWDNRIDVCIEHKDYPSMDLQIGDGCSGGDNVTVQCGDYDGKEFFPLYYMLVQAGMGEVYTIDGGHDDAYNEWVEKHESKNKKGKREET